MSEQEWQYRCSLCSYERTDGDVESGKLAVRKHSVREHKGVAWENMIEEVVRGLDVVRGLAVRSYERTGRGE